jgi:hypothetical protein
MQYTNESIALTQQFQKIWILNGGVKTVGEIRKKRIHRLWFITICDFLVKY